MENETMIDDYIKAFNRYYKALEDNNDSTEIIESRNAYYSNIKNLHNIKAPGSNCENDIAAWHRFHMEHVVKYFGKTKQLNY